MEPGHDVGPPDEQLTGTVQLGAEHSAVHHIQGVGQVDILPRHPPDHLVMPRVLRLTIRTQGTHLDVEGQDRDKAERDPGHQER